MRTNIIAPFVGAKVSGHIFVGKNMIIYVIAKKGRKNWVYDRVKDEFVELVGTLKVLRKFQLRTCKLGFKPQMEYLNTKAKEQGLSEPYLFEV